MPSGFRGYGSSGFSNLGFLVKLSTSKPRCIIRIGQSALAKLGCSGKLDPQPNK